MYVLEGCDSETPRQSEAQIKGPTDLGKNCPGGMPISPWLGIMLGMLGMNIPGGRGPPNPGGSTIQCIVCWFVFTIMGK